MQLLASAPGHRLAEPPLVPSDFFGQDADERPLMKVLFYLPIDWHGHASETLWAEWVGGNQARLLNTPFFAKGISRFDVVAVKRDDGWLALDRVILRSGHSTIRLVISPEADSKALQKALNRLRALGCVFEDMSVGGRCLQTVDLPPQVDFDTVHDALERGERAGLWQYEEGHCGHHV